MKLALIAAVSLLASCKDKPREPAPAPAPTPGSAAAPAGPATPAAPVPPATPDAGGAAAEAPLPDVCRISVVALEQASCPTPEVRQTLLGAKKSIDSVVETIAKVGGANPRQFQVMCAQILLAIEQDAAKLKCTIALDARQRAEITAMLDAWYGQRTAVVPTGDAAADAVIGKIAAVRDAACECRDVACLDRLQPQLGAVGTMPQAAPEAARTLARKLLEDAGRCAARARTMTTPPR